MPRSLSRSPSYRRRYSPSPVAHRYSRRSKRERSRSLSRSPFSNSHSRRRSHSSSPRRRRNRSPSYRRHKSRSPTPRKHNRRQGSSRSLSPLSKSSGPSSTSSERKNAIEKLKKEEEEKKRHQLEVELKLLEEETARRLEEAIRRNVEQRLNSEEAKLEVVRRIAEGREKLFNDIVTQLEKEKEAALMEARQKEVRVAILGLVVNVLTSYLIYVGKLNYTKWNSDDNFCCKLLVEHGFPPNIQ
ncbi:hypothetical protein Dsin_016072 [Dipteronia sinensis]|uniref:Uncharacterized protein n=1 Tax=Dipteronia sinensis TaxID=43782 RepID=A0AAE0AD07_9ROSI|nr:hypothetical protein Dsin_016072 [Dipteronia sinensis]